MEEKIKMLEEHCEFNNPSDCYVIIAISRKKDTPDMTSSKEIVFRDVIKDKDEIARKYLKMRSMINNYVDLNGRSFPFYLYVSLNPRNGRKTTIELNRRIIDWIEREENDKDVLSRYKQTYSEFYSCLALSKCRGSVKYYMVDLDTKDERVLKSLLAIIGDNLITLQPTRHGYHIKFKPFDRRLIPDTEVYTVHTDGLFFVEYFQNGI